MKNLAFAQLVISSLVFFLSCFPVSNEALAVSPSHTPGQLLLEELRHLSPTGLVPPIFMWRAAGV